MECEEGGRGGWKGRREGRGGKEGKRNAGTLAPALNHTLILTYNCVFRNAAHTYVHVYILPPLPLPPPNTPLHTHTRAHTNTQTRFLAMHNLFHMQASVQAGKWAHLLLWTLQGLRVIPINSSTRVLLSTYTEAAVSLFSSPVIMQQVATDFKCQHACG